MKTPLVLSRVAVCKISASIAPTTLRLLFFSVCCSASVGLFAIRAVRGIFVSGFWWQSATGCTYINDLSLKVSGDADMPTHHTLQMYSDLLTAHMKYYMTILFVFLAKQCPSSNTYPSAYNMNATCFVATHNTPDSHHFNLSNSAIACALVMPPCP